MKTICVIPSRYGSSRFPGKPLSIINGKPMIYWVWSNCKKVEHFDQVIVATDDVRIRDVVESFGGKVFMTPTDCGSPTERIKLVTDEIEADFYVMVNGDEPLLKPDDISKCMIDSVIDNEILVVNLMTDCLDPVDVIDRSNIKVVTNENGDGIYLSRSPIPCPKTEMDFIYHKFVGVTGFTKAALDYFVNTPRGILESIEDVDELRFIENKKSVRFVNAHCNTLSVDTEKDIEAVERKMKESRL